MFQSELARFKVKGNQVIPSFAQPEDDVVPLVIDLFKEGRKLSEINEDVKTLSKVYDYKLVKGLSTVMSRLCEFTGGNGYPLELRRFLFSKGPVLDRDRKEEILREASRKFKVEDPLEYLYSDMKDEMKVSHAPRVSPEEIVSMYNLSLLQTILFKAFRMKVYMSSRWKEVIRLSKSLGLMYYAYVEPPSVEFIGPMTLLKLTERYGRNLALLIPEIVKAGDWKIEAEVVLGKKRRIFNLKVESSPLIKYVKEGVRDEGKKETFDSTVEESFYREFRAVAKDWEIVREPGFLVVDDGSGRVMIPDFLAKKGNFSVYIEVVGFWTKEYLEEKIYKLRNVKEKVLVLIDEDLSTERIDSDDVIKFRKKIDVTKVYQWLNRKMPKPSLTELKLDGDYIRLMDMARKSGVQIKDVRSVVEKMEDYVVLKTFAVKKRILEGMSNEDFSGKDVSYVKAKYGDFAEEALEFLGYKIRYKDLFNAVISR
ncbi:DUF790 family protein [Sulfuracidifex tepidarius]|uniref:DUF790 family protein n=1 Tax=Sulfuracidifex tepidarius TaxID=1294262 RepID=A0A510DW25_9CREN|nr:DUF790 family protein [Sulfuracidifex tepidarius]BBG24168.1 hypothetical protein IC006_1472 [Sulfuracidifex tepidarius]BBG26925.1 hypothetical protein IC007_1449 [Sulfuracidifex tepidarius]